MIGHLSYDGSQKRRQRWKVRLRTVASAFSRSLDLLEEVREEKKGSIKLITLTPGFVAEYQDNSVIIEQRSFIYLCDMRNTSIGLSLDA